MQQRDFTTFAVGLGGWLEIWRVMLISAFNKVEVEVEAELGNKNPHVDSTRRKGPSCLILCAYFLGV